MITLPVAYRLVGTSINAGQPEQLGSEQFSVTTVAVGRRAQRARAPSSQLMQRPRIGTVIL
jgi:hypothetical protein